MANPAVAQGEETTHSFKGKILRLMGHLYGDVFIKDTNLEGWSARDTGKFYAKALRDLQAGSNGQISDELIPNEWDQPVDKIVTESEVIEALNERNDN